MMKAGTAAPAEPQKMEPVGAGVPMKDLICVQGLLDRALETKDYFRIRSFVAGLPHVMGKWIHADDLVKKAAGTDVSATVQDIVGNLPKTDLLTLEQSAQKAEAAPETSPAAEPEGLEEEPEL